MILKKPNHSPHLFFTMGPVHFKLSMSDDLCGFPSHRSGERERIVFVGQKHASSNRIYSYTPMIRGITKRKFPSLSFRLGHAHVGEPDFSLEQY